MLVEMGLCEIITGNDQPVIVLSEKTGERQFPVFIGPFEAEALERSVRHNLPKLPRPLTHDLVLNAIKDLGGSLTRVIIDKLENDTFYGKLDVRKSDNTTVWIDSRPSDAVVIASKTGVPIFCDSDILDRIGNKVVEDDSFDL